MRVPARYLAILAMAFTTSLSAQPYGLLEGTGYWKPLGRYDTGFSLEETGNLLAFSRYGMNAGPNSFSSLSVLEVFEQEQLRRGHGSYWQVWVSATFKCKQGTFRVTRATYFNKPRFVNHSADKLWEEKYRSDDKDFEPVEKGTLAEAAMKEACSEPVGMN